jgi:hypothetical protein
LSFCITSVCFCSCSHCYQNVAGRPGSKSLSGATALFGADLETVVARESLTGGVPGGVATSVTLATQAPSAVPIIIRRCVEEVERRGLDIIGSVTQK